MSMQSFGWEHMGWSRPIAMPVGHPLGSSPLQSPFANSVT
jgi:hypothetical protein